MKRNDRHGHKLPRKQSSSSPSSVQVKPGQGHHSPFTTSYTAAFQSCMADTNVLYQSPFGDLEQIEEGRNENVDERSSMLSASGRPRRNANCESCVNVPLLPRSTPFLSHQHQQQIVVKRSSLPILGVSTRIGNKIASNVTSTTTTGETKAASSSVSKTKRKPEEATSEKPKLLASRKVRLTISASQQVTDPHSTPGTIVKPSSSTQICQLLAGVTERVSGLSLDASNYLNPIRTCSVPRIDPPDHHNIYKRSPSKLSVSRSVGRHEADKRSATERASCMTNISYAKPQALNSDLIGYHLNHRHSLISDNDDFISSRKRQRDSNTPSHKIGLTSHAWEENEGTPPMTEVTWETMYPSKKALKTRDMAHEEKLDQTMSDIIVKVAMLSHNQDLSNSTSFDRKREAKRWTAVVSRQQQHQEQPQGQPQSSSTNMLPCPKPSTPTWLSPTSEPSAEKSQESMAVLFSNNPSWNTRVQPHCQSVLSLPLLASPHVPPLSTSPMRTPLPSLLRPRSILVCPASSSLNDRLKQEDQAPLSRYREEHRRRKHVRFHDLSLSQTVRSPL